MLSRLSKYLKRKFTQKDEPIFSGGDPIKINLDLIIKYLPKNPVIVDCGAHVGVDTVQFAKIPGSRIYAIEAVPELFIELVENTKPYENVSCFNIALSDIDGKSKMFKSSGSSDGSSSLMKPKQHLVDHPDVFFEEVIDVECKKIDTWTIENMIPPIDMLWLDMQGAEQKMLEASKKVIREISVIHTEVSTRETYEGVLPYHDFRSFLENNGFNLEIEAIPKSYDMGNVLFVRV